MVPQPARRLVNVWVMRPQPVCCVDLPCVSPCDMAVADNVRLNQAITPKDGETGPTQNTLISEPASRQAERDSCCWRRRSGSVHSASSRPWTDEHGQYPLKGARLSALTMYKHWTWTLRWKRIVHRSEGGILEVRMLPSCAARSVGS